MSFFSSLFGRKPKNIRQPQFASHYYPDDAQQLTTLIDQIITSKQTITADLSAPPRALIVPFAQLSVAAPCFGAAYATLASYKTHYDHIVIIAPSLRIPLQGFAGSTVDAFACPTGYLRLDRTWCQTPELIRDLEPIHLAEPSIEVQLPFLFNLEPKWTITPLLMGDGRLDTPLQIMRQVWQTPRTLLIVATQLSYELNCDEAMKQDQHTLHQLQSHEPKIGRLQASGKNLLNALSTLAGEAQSEVHLLAHSHSGQTISPQPPLVISYAAMAYT